MKIYGLAETRGASGLKKKQAAGRSFQAATPSSAQSAAGAAAAAPAAMMSALIDLQSDGGGKAKTYAAAQRTLDLLDKIRLQLLDGAPDAAVLEALSAAASARPHASADQGLQDVFEQIKMRARVELAKRGR